MLTNAGLVYFKVDEMKKEEDLEPQNFKPLSDFVLVEVPESVSLSFIYKCFLFITTNIQ